VKVKTRRLAEARYEGQGDELTVGVGSPFDGERLRERFEQEHETRYGYTMEADIRVVSLRAVGVVEHESPKPRVSEGGADVPVKHRSAVFESGEYETAFYDGFPTGEIKTPAVIEADETTAVVPPGWSATGGEKLEITKGNRKND